MNKIFAVLLSLGLLSCNTNINSIKTHVDKINQNPEYGLIDLKLNNKGNFNIKAVNFSLSEIKKIKIDILGANITGAISQTKDYSNNSVEFNIPVLAGKNRIVILSGLDSQNNIISQLKGGVDIIANQNNVAKITYLDTVVANIVLSIMDIKPDLLNTISYEKIKNLVIELTGYNEISNVYTKLNPVTLNISEISSHIINNPELIMIPSSLNNIASTGTINLILNQANVDVSITDLNSEKFESTSTSSVIKNVSYGKWNIVLKKDGYKTYSSAINVNSTKPLELNITLMRDPSVVTGGIQG